MTEPVLAMRISSGRASFQFDPDRTCEVCGIRLSRYNSEPWCYPHRQFNERAGESRSLSNDAHNKRSSRARAARRLRDKCGLCGCVRSEHQRIGDGWACTGAGCCCRTQGSRSKARKAVSA